MRAVENNFFLLESAQCEILFRPTWYTVRHLILLSLDYRLIMLYENLHASSNVNMMFLFDLYF